ncbi:MAG: hypothetical protein FWE47_01365 [Oscillospiraceae bacterium]|nr:hypothetical protein [Oscillospiraceae bacterium]
MKKGKRCKRCNKGIALWRGDYGPICAGKVGVPLGGPRAGAQYDDEIIFAIEDWLFKKMTKKEQSEILRLKRIWHNAAALGDRMMMDAAHRAAAQIRMKYDKNYTSYDNYQHADYTTTKTRSSAKKNNKIEPLPQPGPEPTTEQIITTEPRSTPTGVPYDTTIKGVPIKYYVTDKGAARISYDQNDYGQLVAKDGMKELAQEIYRKAKSINPYSMSGRTVSGVNTEIQLHYLLYTFIGDYKKEPHIAHIGGIGKEDRNAIFFEAANTAKMVARIFLDPKGYDSLLKEIIEVHLK